MTHPIDDSRYQIAIEVETRYIEEQSDAIKGRYVFAYTITIINEGAQTVQLLRRHWHITDGNGEIQEVEGEGVVGEQPLIAPGESYTYTSGAILDTPVGAMQGHYLMESADGVRFEAEIPPFTLAAPHTLH